MRWTRRCRCVKMYYANVRDICSNLINSSWKWVDYFLEETTPQNFQNISWTIFMFLTLFWDIIITSKRGETLLQTVAVSKTFHFKMGQSLFESEAII